MRAAEQRRASLLDSEGERALPAARVESSELSRAPECSHCGCPVDAAVDYCPGCNALVCVACIGQHKHGARVQARFSETVTALVTMLPFAILAAAAVWS